MREQILVVHTQHHCLQWLRHVLGFPSATCPCLSILSETLHHLCPHQERPFTTPPRVVLLPPLSSWS